LCLRIDGKTIITFEGTHQVEAVDAGVQEVGQFLLDLEEIAAFRELTLMVRLGIDKVHVQLMDLQASRIPRMHDETTLHRFALLKPLVLLQVSGALQGIEVHDLLNGTQLARCVQTNQLPIVEATSFDIEDL
jgi:hypothetical protein